MLLREYCQLEALRMIMTLWNESTTATDSDSFYIHQLLQRFFQPYTNAMMHFNHHALNVLASSLSPPEQSMSLPHNEQVMGTLSLEADHEMDRILFEIVSNGDDGHDGCCEYSGHHDHQNDLSMLHYP